MKLIWHIISKDIVRDRWALLLWASLFVGQDAIGVFARNAIMLNADRVMYLQMGSAGLVFLQVIMGYVLVARWVQADALIGTSMFWRTRPISAGRLLTAKLSGVLLTFAVLPVLLLLPWWLYCQFGWRDILWTAIDVVGRQLLLIAPAFLVASLTDDLGRVLLWTLLLVIGLMSWVVLLQSSLAGSLVRLPSGRLNGSVMFTRLWACSLLLIVGSLAVAAHQYLTRRFARSVGLVVFCLGLIALAGEVWPWNWSRTFAAMHRPALEPAAPGLLERLAFSVMPAKGNFGGGFKAKNADDRDASLNLGLRVTGLPDDMAIGADTVNQTWTWANGVSLTRSSSFYWWNNTSGNVVLRRKYSLPVPEDDPETTRWKQVRRERKLTRANAGRAARGAPLLPGWDPDSPAGEGAGARLHAYNTLPNSFLAKMQAEPPAYRAEAHWLLVRREVIAELPFKDEARAAGGGQTLHLLQVKGDKPLLLSTRPSLTQFGVWYAAASDEFRSWFSRERYAAVNRVTGDIHAIWDGQWGSRNLLVGGVFVTWNVLGLAPRMAIRNDQDVPADPQWRDHSILVLMEDKDVARFDRVVETAKFALEPDAKDKNTGAAGP